MTDSSATGGPEAHPAAGPTPTAPAPADQAPDDNTTIQDPATQEEKHDARVNSDLPRTPSHGEAPPENGEPLAPGEEKRDAADPEGVVTDPN